MKESFLLYKAFYEPIKHLTDEQMGRLFRAIYEYQLGGIEPQVEDAIYMAFMFFKNQFRLDDEKYTRLVEKQRDNGKRGGRPKKEPFSEEPNETQETQPFSEEPTKAYNENDNVNDNEKENVNEKVSLSAKRGVPAAGEDTEKFRSAVLKVFFFRNLIDPMAEVDRFFAHYRKTGWADGNGNPIRDIPAAAQCWEQKVPKSNVRRPFAADFVEAWQQIYDEVSELLPGTDITPLLEIRAAAIDSKKQEIGLKVTPALDAFIRTHPDIQPVFRKYINSRVKWGIVK